MASHLCAERENQALAIVTTYYTTHVPSNAIHRQSPNHVGVRRFWKFPVSLVLSGVLSHWLMYSGLGLTQANDPGQKPYKNIDWTNVLFCCLISAKVYTYIQFEIY